MSVALVRSRLWPSVSDTHPPTTTHPTPRRVSRKACDDKAWLCSAEFPQMYLAKANLPHGYTPSLHRGGSVYTHASGNTHTHHWTMHHSPAWNCDDPHMCWGGEWNWLHIYSCAQDSQGQFISGTAWLCPIFSGSKWWAMPHMGNPSHV